VAYVLGVDLGATNLRVALGTADGTIVRRADEPVPATADELVRRVVALAGGEPFSGAAIGVPGVPAGDGFGRLIAGAAGLTGAPLRALLRDALGVPVRLENDLNLAAVAEQRARGVDDLVFVGVGTGVGMGIVSGGRLLRGAHGAAGELGHLPLAARDAVAGPDGLGPLEALAGGAGLARGWERPHEAYASDAAHVLAAGLRSVQVLLDPELIVLGGGIGTRVLDHVRAALLDPKPNVELSVHGEDAGLVGALLVAHPG
jgi:glucokinase